MRALLLAAGAGTRLRPLTNTTPKCLVEIHGRPLLDYWLELVFAAGVERALINTHHLAEKVEAHVKGSPWREQVDLVHEPELLGTAGTLAANRRYFGAGPFLVAHADNLTDVDVCWLIERHERRPSGCAVTMLAFHTDDPRSCGILELDEHEVVQRFHEKVEKPPGTLANAAVYIFEPEVAAYAESLGKPCIDLSTEVIPAFIGRILSAQHAGYHRDIGNPHSLERARAEFRPKVAQGAASMAVQSSS
jgi:mannose-1-phosphate guanylyltransferase